MGVYSGLWQVAMLWGMGLMVAITICGPISGAHFNPAVTLAFATTTTFPWRRVGGYILAQCLGALVGAALVYLLYGASITAYEAEHGLLRGTSESVRTAMVFGEYFPNPAAVAEIPALGSTTQSMAFGAELVGTALLAFAIFCLIRLENLPGWLIPILIGVTLTVLISLFAPLSMAGFNPARDLIPRVLSYFLGWREVVFQANGMGYLTVYVIAPVIGAQIGAVAAKALMRD